MAKSKPQSSAPPSAPVSSLFKPAINEQAFVKAGFLGFGGSGKTHTAVELAMGLSARLSGKRDKVPVAFIDSETGSDFWVEESKARGIPLLVSKTRAFSDLVVAIPEAQRIGAILVVDSISHFWAELQAAWKQKKNRSKLYFQDWGPLKDEWNKGFSSPFVNSPVHVIMCGRAAYEYDYGTDADGEKQLEKTGIKMKAETELGYEPSLLVRMEKEMRPVEVVAGVKAAKDAQAKSMIDNVAYVVKDRSRQLHGHRIVAPTFDSWLPFIEMLNIGGNHLGFDAARSSKDRFNDEPEKRIHQRITDCKILVEEINGLLMVTIPGMSALEKSDKQDMVFKSFNTRSWTQLENMKLEQLAEGYEKLQALCASYKKREPAKVG
jgi:hypothetical protein